MNWWLVWIERQDGAFEKPQVVAAKYAHMALMEVRDIGDGESVHVLNVAIDVTMHRNQDPILSFDHQEWEDFMDQQRMKFPEKFNDR